MNERNQPALTREFIKRKIYRAEMKREAPFYAHDPIDLNGVANAVYEGLIELGVITADRPMK